MTINDYWRVISKKHQYKVLFLAKKHEVSTNQVFRNIIHNLVYEIRQEQNGHFCGYLTGIQIERMIDQVSR
jgi:hypothetical protein